MCHRNVTIHAECLRDEFLRYKENQTTGKFIQNNHSSINKAYKLKKIKFEQKWQLLVPFS